MSAAVAFVSAVETDLASARAARALLPAAFGDVDVLASARLSDDGAVRAAFAATRVVVVRMLGGRAYFERGFAVLAELARERGLAIVALPGDAHPDPELDAISTVPPGVLRRAHAYAHAGGAENLASLLRLVSDAALGTAHGAAAPRDVPEWGFYHPAARDRDACARLDRAAFAAAHHRGGRGVVGVPFYRADWVAGNLAHVDALVAALDAAGLDATPVFTYSLREGERVGDLPRAYAGAFLAGGRACVDAIVSLLAYASSELAHGERSTRSVGPALRADALLGVPLIQAVGTAQSVAEWAASASGLTPLDAAMKVVMPEFDGKIVGPLFAYRDPATQLAIAEPEQTRALARLAERYVRLRRLPNAEKRIAIVLTNFANRQGRVGSAVGLDTPASVIALLRALAADGYAVGEIPPDGDALMEALLARGGYDAESLTADQLARADGRFTRERYAAWHAAFPASVRDEVREQWGPPPGDAYRVGDEVYVAGLRLGNVLVMIQPPRGFGENPLAVYHSGDLVPTHQYLGAYRWLRDDFAADAIVHCGKHGTLEWLPGKALGLSPACYPALALDAIPLFYPFIVNDPGEGTQAKRRAHACVIDHLVPPMTKAETYDELARLQRLLGEYAAAERVDPDKLPLIARTIWESVVAADLQRDLGVDAPPDGEGFAEFLQHVDGYLCEIGDLQIRDGLHVLGAPPEGGRLASLALAMVRLDAPQALGIMRALCEDLGMDYGALADPARGGEPFGALPAALRAFAEPATPGGSGTDAGAAREGAVTVRLAREALDRCARALTDALVADAAPNVRDAGASVARVLAACGLPAAGEAARTLTFVAERVVPDIRRSTDELANLVAGLRGGHVPPGPSGAPTRGMTDALPTGRNFYSVDVRAIPSRFAWTVGRRLGDALLAAALERDGAHPRAVGITVWGTSNMRTQGDDVAEILWLLGVRPVWNVESGRVTGIEPIPLAELGRARVDVTVRISGFFRDAFPGVVALLDRAVAMVAALEEPAELNAVRANVLADEAARVAAGARPAEAARRARFRVFGNRPGAYGTGVLPLIAAGAWETAGDLAEVYLQSSGFAYGESAHGEPAPAEFRARLAASSVAVQNQDNREHDIFDSDDYLQFHGGMIAAMRELRGAEPTALFGDSSNPDAPKVRGLADEARRVFRARVANPKWLAGVRRHGYKGALEMAATVDYLFGYDATAGVVEDWMYERVARAYVLDEASRAFLERSNPWSAREMTERLLEAAQRGMWARPDGATLEALRERLVDFEGALEDRTETAHAR